MKYSVKRQITCLIGLFLSCIATAQLSRPELYKITHTPPDATALGKYGEYPVSLYSGVPNIEIPIFQINLGRIKIPVSLSYHAGGIKVEEIASSVGLGWSLGAGGAITRSVKGMPDEQEYIGGYNFFTDPRPISTRIDPPPNNSDSILAYKNFWGRIIQASVDGEPDVYNFNFGTYSGKFLYHQADGRFYCAPHTALRIERNNDATFKITDENGIQYDFINTETSTRTSSSSEVLETITSWYLTDIYDPIAQRNIHFTYAAYAITYPVASSESHYMPFYGADEYSNAKQNPVYSLKRLKKISFEDGYIRFEHNLYRCDLPGDSALTGIKVYNNQGLLVKDYTLNYDYFLSSSPSSCSDINESVNKRLKLLSVNQNPTDGSSLPPLTHTLEYNETSLPNRLSFAQDHWGFYNGKSNAHLYPPYTMHLPYQTVPLSGGDRNIDSNVTQAGILTKITFPTGGHTEFQYESNRADNPALPSTLNTRTRVEGGHIGGAPRGEFYFSITSSSCAQNSNHENGGAYINWQMGGLDIAMIQTLGFPGKSAEVTIINIDSPQHSLQMVLVGDGKITAPESATIYLPNGNYKLVADFSENPFTFTYDATTISLNWTECTETTAIDGIDRLAGGVRIKKITSYTDATTIATVKTYKYVKNINSSSSSGQTHFYPSYIYTVNRPAQPDNGDGILGYSYYTKMCIKRTSTSSYPLLNESGKSVGYSNVIEMDGENGENGYTEYKYTNYSDYDDFYNFSGYEVIATPTSYNWLRGLELERKVYKKENNQYELIAETLNDYDTSLLTGNKKHFKGIIGHWVGLDDAYLLEPGGLDPFTYRFEPAINTYTVFSDFVYLKKSRQRTYANGSYIEKEINYTYNPKNLMPAVVDATNSNGIKDITTTKYPLDYNVTNPLTAKAQSIQQLQDLNYITPPIEQYNEKQVGTGSKRLKVALFTSFKSGTPLPDTVYTLTDNSINNYTGINIGASAYTIHTNYKPEVINEKYGFGDILLQQKKNNNISTSYLWNYQNSYPVCEVKNAANDNIAYTSFEADDWGGWTMTPGSTILNNAGITGQKSFSGTLNRASLPVGNYVLTLWSNYNASVTVNGQSGTAIKTIGDWRLYEWKLSNISSVAIVASNIDEVRLYPQDAQMATYTFTPLLGMTSQCDANNRIIYYEYDGFGRLKLIRDENKNVLKTFDYQYQQALNQ